MNGCTGTRIPGRGRLTGAVRLGGGVPEAQTYPVRGFLRNPPTPIAGIGESQVCQVDQGNTWYYQVLPGILPCIFPARFLGFY